jgi:phosphoglycerate dehydrogenase-like enzyme
MTTGSRAEAEALVADADFVVVLHVDAALVEKMDHVRLVQYHGTGYQGKIDVAACRAAGIRVARAPGGNTVEVAEHAILLILAVLRRLPGIHNAVKRGAWPMWEHRLHLHNLEGRRVGIVGFGRIGQAVAQRAKAFETEIVYHDVRPIPPEVEAASGARRLELDTLLSTADVVVLNVPITPQTRGMIDAHALRMMKPSAILINVARGAVVDEAALVRALRTGQIAGAGLDVFLEEPIPPDSPLLALDNVVLTPHVASGTRESLVKKARAWYRNFELVAAGEAPENVVT